MSKHKHITASDEARRTSPPAEGRPDWSDVLACDFLQTTVGALMAGWCS